MSAMWQLLEKKDLLTPVDLAGVCDALHLVGVALAERGREGDLRAAEAFLRRALRAPGMSAEARADAELLHQALRLKLAGGASAN